MACEMDMIFDRKDQWVWDVWDVWDVWNEGLIPYYD